MHATVHNLVLETQKRDMSVKPKALRAKSRIPAVYYGMGKENMHLTADYQSFRKLYESAGGNTVIDLKIDDKSVPVLIYDVQYDPVSDAFAHIDFKHVDMNKKVVAEVKIVVVGVAPAVKNFGGVLEITRHSFEIECLPKDLIHSIEVDVSGLDELNMAVHVSDLKIPATIKLLAELEDTVVKVSAPRKEEEVVPVAEVAVEGADAEKAKGDEGKDSAEGTEKKEK